ncbi:MAG: 3-phosphoshikimate 1-carboxyvinyltransferase [Anaerolineae bacterium]|nr:3-phosphoshikimate 1-carboxyvinyltransferase [Anaerolineae bacterium]
MNQTLAPPRRMLGRLRPPSDRSITVRAALLGALADGETRVRHPLDSDDAQAAMHCARALGAAVEFGEELVITGRGLRGLHAPAVPLHCDSSGTTMRLLAGLVAGLGFDCVIDGSPQLRRRPMRRISEPLTQMGARIGDVNGCAPLTLRAAALRGIDYSLPVASAQVKSAILLAGLNATGQTTTREPAPTRDHTERMLRAMGVDARTQGNTTTLTPPAALHAISLTAPGDFSSAAFFIVAGLLHPRADITLLDVGINPTRTGLLDALRMMGAAIAVENLSDEGGEPVAALRIQSTGLRGIEIAGDLTARMIDELPVLAVAATQARGVTVVRDAQELRVKESNRLEGLVAELRKLGAQIEATPDGFVVEGPTPLRGANVDGLGDHRMAMSLAAAALVATGETTLLGAECVAKTYPEFFADLERLMER